MDLFVFTHGDNMLRQFLLNTDGSVPDGTNLAALQAANVVLVIPTVPPLQDGTIAIEQPPAQDENGVWHQVWKIEPAPDVAVPETLATAVEEPVDPLSTLTLEQKQALIALLQAT